MKNIAQNKKDTKLEKIPQNLISTIYFFQLDEAFICSNPNFTLI